MKPIMDEGLILREYKQAKDKNLQIEILADLNNVSTDEMLEFLTEKGAISGIKKNRRPPVKWDAEMDSQVSRLAAEGFTQKEITEKLGITAQAIADRKRRLSMPPLKKQTTNKVAFESATSTKVKKDRCVTGVMHDIVKMLNAVGLEVNECSIDVLNRSFYISGAEHGS